jgi:hypothetical protein
VLLLGALAVGSLLPSLRRLVADSVARIAYESEPLPLDPGQLRAAEMSFSPYS